MLRDYKKRVASFKKNENDQTVEKENTRIMNKLIEIANGKRLSVPQ